LKLHFKRYPVAPKEHDMSATRAGMDFSDLSRGGERNYSCSYLVNLDPDVLKLALPEESYIDTSRNILIQHVLRIMDQLATRSGRGIDQFCFGSTYLQLNPNYRKFDKMDPITWKKEGISNLWSGSRGFRKSCCKLCCNDKTCNGCKECLCRQGPVRGSYDGMVMLTAITKECLQPNTGIKVDHEDFTNALECALTTHFMYEDNELSNKCCHSGKLTFLSEYNPKLGKAKKYPAYVLYVAYRLDKTEMNSATSSAVEGFRNYKDATVESEESLDLGDEDEKEVIGELEDKLLLSRLTRLEKENHTLREMVKKLDHGRLWLEERVAALEDFNKNIPNNNEFENGITEGNEKDVGGK